MPGETVIAAMILGICIIIGGALAGGLFTPVGEGSFYSINRLTGNLHH